MRTCGYFNSACPDQGIQIIQHVLLHFFKGIIRDFDIPEFTRRLLWNTPIPPRCVNMIEIVEV